jgi:hypothetical protein
MQCQGKDYSLLLKKYIECSCEAEGRVDPYSFEIDNEVKVVVLCDYHYQERKDDI